MGLIFGYGSVTERAQGVALIRAACERGYTFFAAGDIRNTLPRFQDRTRA